MYEVIEQASGRRLALCEQPRCIKINPNSGVYIRCKQSEAEGVAVNGEVYSLNGRIPDRPEAKICELDAGAIAASAEQQASELLKIKAAMCELDLANEQEDE